MRLYKPCIHKYRSQKKRSSVGAPPLDSLIFADTNGTLRFNRSVFFTNNYGQNYGRVNDSTNGDGAYMGPKSSFFTA